MKKYFEKTICEPRNREEDYYDNGRQKDCKKLKEKYNLEDDYVDFLYPKFEPMSRGRGNKEPTINTKPLVRFLNKKSGQHWDDVYSEIKKTFIKTNIIDEYLWKFVELNPIFDNGIPYMNYSNSFGMKLELVYFYVDNAGILQKAPKKKSYKNLRKEKEVERIKNSDIRELNGVYFVKKDGIWFETKLVPIPKYRYKKEKIKQIHFGEIEEVELTIKKYPNFVDKFICSEWFNYRHYPGYTKMEKLVNLCRELYGKDAYCAQLIQLNGKKLRQLGLTGE